MLPAALVRAALARASVVPLVLSQALITLIARQPRLYARHREPLLIAAFLVHNRINILCSERSSGLVMLAACRLACAAGTRAPGFRPAAPPTPPPPWGGKVGA